MCGVFVRLTDSIFDRYVKKMVCYSATENAHCNGHADDRNDKQEAVYHDLCAIHRASRTQVFLVFIFFFSTEIPFFFQLLLF